MTKKVIMEARDANENEATPWDLSLHEPPPRLSPENLMTEYAISVAIIRMESSTRVVDPVPAKLFDSSTSYRKQPL